MPKYSIPPHLQPIMTNASAMIEAGHQVHFKYTCLGCGVRQAFEEANTFYPAGKCEECGHTTSTLDPKAEVNFLLIIVGGGLPPFVFPHKES